MAAAAVVAPETTPDRMDGLIEFKTYNSPTVCIRI